MRAATGAGTSTAGAHQSMVAQALRAVGLACLVACTSPTAPAFLDSGADAAEALPDSGIAETAADAGNAYAWRLPPGFPVPIVPIDNPMSQAKAELGRHLFYDMRLSFNGTQSCASCHQQEKAFGDGRTLGVGSTGELHPRNSMALFNIAYATTLTWANPQLASLEAQAAVPLFGSHPIELGMQGHEEELCARLAAVPTYAQLFKAAYPYEPNAITVPNVLKALATFQRTLLSGNSPYDRYLRGDTNAISASARRGEALFNSEKMECFHCHVGFNLQDAVTYVGKSFAESAYHNTGLYNVDGRGGYPEGNVGLFEFTGVAADMGKFRTPSLRNIAVTAPYMHDGSIATLEEVLDHYAAGGRTIADGPHAGAGSANPHKSAFLIGFRLSAQQKADVLAFLNSLTDEDFLRDPTFADPWRRDVPQAPEARASKP